MSGRKTKCPECGKLVSIDGAEAFAGHSASDADRIGDSYRYCRASFKSAKHVLAAIDEALAAERAAIREEVQSLYEGCGFRGNTAEGALLSVLSLLDERSDGESE